MDPEKVPWSAATHAFICITLTSTHTTPCPNNVYNVGMTSYGRWNDGVGVLGMSKTVKIMERKGLKQNNFIMSFGR